MEPNIEPKTAEDVSADELLLLIAYRHCTERRKIAIRIFAEKLESLTPALAVDNVVHFKPRQI